MELYQIPINNRIMRIIKDNRKWSLSCLCVVSHSPLQTNYDNKLYHSLFNRISQELHTGLKLIERI